MEGEGKIIYTIEIEKITMRRVSGRESHCSKSFSARKGFDLIAEEDTSDNCNNSASKQPTSPLKSTSIVASCFFRYTQYRLID